MPSKRPRSKRDLASDNIELALSDASKALSLLGGRTRFRSKTVPADNTYVARQYLEGIVNRLKVVQLLVIAKDTTDVGKQMAEIEAAAPRDSFEQQFDSERRPDC